MIISCSKTSTEASCDTLARLNIPSPKNTSRSTNNRERTGSNYRSITNIHRELETRPKSVLHYMHERCWDSSLGADLRFPSGIHRVPVCMAGAGIVADAPRVSWALNSRRCWRGAGLRGRDGLMTTW
jgi:hypothetical protein